MDIKANDFNVVAGESLHDLRHHVMQYYRQLIVTLLQFLWWVSFGTTNFRAPISLAPTWYNISTLPPILDLSIASVDEIFPVLFLARELALLVFSLL